MRLSSYSNIFSIETLYQTLLCLKREGRLLTCGVHDTSIICLARIEKGRTNEDALAHKIFRESNFFIGEAGSTLVNKPRHIYVSSLLDRW